MHTQPGSKAPVTYDPCEVIEVQINPEGAPDDYREYVDTAIEHVSEPSGLRLEVTGETDERPSRTPRTTSGSGWKPVLVAWADDEEVPALAGDVAGLGRQRGRRVAGPGALRDRHRHPRRRRLPADHPRARRRRRPHRRSSTTSSATWSGSTTSTTRVS